MTRRFLASCLCWCLWVGSGLSLSLHQPQTTVQKYFIPGHSVRVNQEPSDSDTSPVIFSRRQTLATVAAAATLFSPLLSSSFVAHASPLIPDPQAITTVVLDSPDSNKNQKIGVELYDVKIGSNPIQTFPAVKAVQPEGAAASANVEPGMIVLGNFPEGSKSVIARIQKGPYPIVLQFYNLAKTAEDSPLQALLAAQQASKEAAAVKEPALSSKGTGLIVKTVQKPTGSCPEKARRGDTLQVNFEARVASPGGPVYDSTQERGKPVSFVVGSGEVVNGVDIGVYDMCPGEIREMDIPTTLGYGRGGSQVFDIPGDVRLWWRVELLQITKKKGK